MTESREAHMEKVPIKKLMSNYSFTPSENKHFKLGTFFSLSHCSAQIVREYAEKLSQEVEAVSSRKEFSLCQDIDFKIPKEIFMYSGFTSANRIIKAVFHIPGGWNVKREPWQHNSTF